jgi:hypothetical protein
MWIRIFELLKRDAKAGCHSWYLFIISLVPLVFILLMLLGFPFLADIILSTKNFDLYTYYSLTGITLASAIPVISGHFYAFLFEKEKNTHKPYFTDTHLSDQKLALRTRLVSSFLFSLVFLLIFVFSTDPVQGEGWLRNCYVSLLFALQSPVVFLFANCNAGMRIKVFIVTSLYGLFIIAVPFGLITYHPWNYMAFFSPFYWVAWAWVISIPFESIVYGLIATVLALGYFFLICRVSLRSPRT